MNGEARHGCFRQKEVLLQRPWGTPRRAGNIKKACAAGVTAEAGGWGVVRAVIIWLLFFAMRSTAVFSGGGDMV